MTAAAESVMLTATRKIPIGTMGGLKARGHPVGASGVYQIVECVEQLRGEAGANQVPDAHVAMAQSLGGVAAAGELYRAILNGIEAHIRYRMTERMMG